MQTNQRQHERVGTHRPAELHLAQTQLSATLINISLDGAGLVSPQALDEKVDIDVSFKLPDYTQTSRVSLSGTTTHCTKVGRDFLIGVQFNPLTAHEELVVKGFIQFHHRLD